MQSRLLLLTKRNILLSTHLKRETISWIAFLLSRLNQLVFSKSVGILMYTKRFAVSMMLNCFLCKLISNWKVKSGEKRKGTLVC